MRVLNTLYVTGHRSIVRYQSGTLTVTDPDRGKSRVPLNTLDSVVLTGYGQMTTQAITECVRRGIRVAALTRTGRVRFTCGGPVTGNVYLRLAQYRASDDPDATAAIARDLVAAKIQNCRRMLLRWSWDAPDRARWTLTNAAGLLAERLANLAGRNDLNAIRGIEGDATRRYFQGMRAVLAGTDLPFAGRNRRPPRDPVNALLGFVYGLLVAEVTGALDSIGLDPQVGFLHGLRPGRPSLALDLVEELRPAVAERFTVSLIRRRQVQPKDFVGTAGGGWHLTDDARRSVLASYDSHRAEEIPHRLLDRSVPRWSIPTIQATLLARHLRGDLESYPPFIMAN